jgi:hypothetical protein
MFRTSRILAFCALAALPVVGWGQRWEPADTLVVKGIAVAYTDGYRVFDARSRKPLDGSVIPLDATARLSSLGVLLPGAAGRAWWVRMAKETGELLDARRLEGSALLPASARISARSVPGEAGASWLLMPEGEKLHAWKLSTLGRAASPVVSKGAGLLASASRLPGQVGAWLSPDNKLICFQPESGRVLSRPVSADAGALLRQAASLPVSMAAQARLADMGAGERAKAESELARVLPGGLAQVLAGAVPDIESAAAQRTLGTAASVVSGTALGAPLEAGAAGVQSSLVEVNSPFSSALGAARWHFGRGAGVGFDAQGASAVRGGQTDQKEGCASVSDAKGRLLFYTDGRTLWDGQHRAVPTPRPLNGHPSSTTSALALDLTGGRYALLTLDQGGSEPSSASRGLAIAILHAKPAALQVLSQRAVAGNLTEKLAACPLPLDDQGRRPGYWVLAHRAESRAFVAYRLSLAGAILDSVVSELGAYHQSGAGAIGQMVFSGDGRRVAVALAAPGVIEVFDFDGLSGKLSAPRRARLADAYGLAFSPSSEALYAASWLRQQVWRYSLREQGEQAGSDSLSSPLVLSDTAGAVGVLGALQLGPDGAIYVARQDAPAGPGGRYLGRIARPDDFRPVYQAKAVDLEGPPRGQSARMARATMASDARYAAPRSRYGLPAFAAFGRPQARIQAVGTCVGEETVLRALTDEPSRVARYEWTLPGGSQHSGQVLRHRFSAPGSYRVRLKVGWRRASPARSFTDSAHIDTASHLLVITQPVAPQLGADRPLPASGLAENLNALPAGVGIGGDVGVGISDPKSPLTFRWSTGESSRTIAVHAPGLVWVEVQNGGCARRDSVRLFPRMPQIAGAQSQDQMEGHTPNPSAGEGASAGIEDGSTAAVSVPPPAPREPSRWAWLQPRIGWAMFLAPTLTGVGAMSARASAQEGTGLASGPSSQVRPESIVWPFTGMGVFLGFRINLLPTR